MGRTADRLPIYSSSEPDIDWAATEEQFSALEACFADRAPFSEESKTALMEVCRLYLHSRRAEKGAQLRSEAQDFWKQSEEAILRFIEISEGAFPPFTDAGRFVEGTIFDGMEGAPPIQISKRDIEPRSLDPIHSKGEAPVEDVKVHLSRNFLMRLAASLRVGLAIGNAEMASLGAGFRPGQAISQLIGGARAWAIKHGCPFGAGPGGGKSSFSDFLFALHSMFPADLREKQMASSSAMNERLRRYLADGADSGHA